MIDIDYYRLLSIIGLSINYVWFGHRSTDVWLRWKNNLGCKYVFQVLPLLYCLDQIYCFILY